MGKVRSSGSLLRWTGLSLAALGTGPAGVADAADINHPTVIELFQSQGCSSCPPANANLNAIAGRPDVLALSFAVTYWDQLGWKDRFARPEFTNRQWAYAHSGGRGNVSTPQMIINGRGVLVGDRNAEIVAVARRFDRGGSGPRIARVSNTVSVGPGSPRREATVWLVQYDPRVRSVAIRAGENGGRTLPHRNIVVALRAVGTWNGKVAKYSVAPALAPFLSAILVQDGPGGAILAAKRI